MKVLLDECVPRKLKRELADHEVLTVTQHGWSGIENGEPLALAQDVRCLRHSRSESDISAKPQSLQHRSYSLSGKK